MDPLDAVKNTLMEAKNSRFTAGNGINKPAFRSQSKFPLTEDGGCKLVHVIDGIGSVTEEPIPDRQWSISKIPPHVREADERAFTPRLVSLGPFHHQRPGLEFMEAQKLRFLDRLLFDIPLKVLEDSMKEVEGITRQSYTQDFKHIDTDSFTRMTLLDGCFVVELLRLAGRSHQGKLADDPIFATRWMPFSLGLDLLLLENQLSLFVLQKLFELTSSGEEKYSLNSLALQFFKPFRPGKDIAENVNETANANGKCPHLLALFHSSFAPTKNFHTLARRSHRYNTYAGKGWAYSAKLLSLSGLAFEKKKSGGIFNLEMKNRVLKIPQNFIDDATKLALRNLLAYEQNDRRAAPYFTSLVVFFSNILCKSDDARVLMRAGIITQAENDDEEVVKFFNSLVKDLVFDMDKCYLQKLIEDINASSASEIILSTNLTSPEYYRDSPI